jgi:hypothetical protein
MQRYSNKFYPLATWLAAELFSIYLPEPFMKGDQ